ncbi:hypothetical protein HS962_16090 [Pantoea sp. BIGb0393]|uniref:Uncharacterized protein n=1 Tax=Pantoea nemavictus TaxID=2726955 RepID=A0ABU8PX73_9GAMM|nr:hypothetical protein [Pantoea nemavictus]MBA0037723.1 hypothetical protein [Pantoea nemavictus]
MSLNPQDFTVYDIQAFPLVCLNQQAVLPGYASQWEAEMLALLQQGRRLWWSMITCALKRPRPIGGNAVTG